MRSQALLAAGALVLGVLSCSPQPTEGPAADGAWVGTITTEGNVTTVINEAGSVWGGPATLLEEASIGVENGPDEYMFGEVNGVWATDDRIFVVDAQLPALRVYDPAGEHLMDIGRSGPGPGEFTEPAGVAVTDDGDILVIDVNLEIEVFAADGTPKDTWNSGSAVAVFTSDMLVIGNDGAVWVPTLDIEARRIGHAKLGDDRRPETPQLPPELDWEPRCLTYLRNQRESRYCAIPFEPSATYSLMPDGGWVTGTSDAYAFDVHRPDGSRLHVERNWDPVPVSAEEAGYRRAQTTEFIRNRADGGSWSWNGPEIPDHKPAYLSLYADRNGRIWVLREMASRPATDCPDGGDECWIPEGYWLDIFDPDGRFLGSAAIEHRPQWRPFIEDDTVVAIVLDDAGTIMVKRYRLVLPGEESE